LGWPDVRLLLRVWIYRQSIKAEAPAQIGNERKKNINSELFSVCKEIPQRQLLSLSEFKAVSGEAVISLFCL
jgi:hypothetical protein